MSEILYSADGYTVSLFAGGEKRGPCLQFEDPSGEIAQVPFPILVNVINGLEEEKEGRVVGNRSRKFQVMARRMAMLIDPNKFELEEVERVSGDAVCERCQLEYREHPEVIGPTFHLICDGRLVKT